MRQDNGKALKAGKLNVGLSAIVGLTLSAGAMGPLHIKLFSGGTLEIVSGPTLSTTNTWGQGWHVGATSPLKINMAGTAYFVSAGATSVLDYIQCLSEGFEV